VGRGEGLACSLLRRGGGCGVVVVVSLSFLMKEVVELSWDLYAKEFRIV